MNERTLEQLSAECVKIVAAARAQLGPEKVAGCELDLVADNLDATTDELRAALGLAGIRPPSPAEEALRAAVTDTGRIASRPVDPGPPLGQESLEAEVLDALDALLELIPERRSTPVVRACRATLIRARSAWPIAGRGRLRTRPEARVSRVTGLDPDQEAEVRGRVRAWVLGREEARMCPSCWIAHGQAGHPCVSDCGCHEVARDQEELVVVDGLQAEGGFS